MTFERDAYAVLQVVRTADDDVISAAFRALARRYHPDGREPDAARMAEINMAYDRLKTPEARRRYDEISPGIAVGPGRGPASTYDPWQVRRASVAGGDEHDGIIDFGRYTGWKIADLASHDPDYLRWLSRHSTGIRFRDAIARALPGDGQVGRRGNVYS
jgi:curved DNA-binding protein CbpA